MTVVLIIHVAMCLALIGIILLQPGKSDMGIGFGSSSQSIFGSKGAGNFLTKATAIFAGVFLLTSFLITKSRMDDVSKSVIDTDTGNGLLPGRWYSLPITGTGNGVVHTTQVNLLVGGARVHLPVITKCLFEN